VVDFSPAFKCNKSYVKEYSREIEGIRVSRDLFSSGGDKGR